MAPTFKKLKRVFIFDKTELADPNPSMTPEEVKKFYSPNYGGALNTAAVKGPDIKDGKMFYTFIKPKPEYKA